MTLEKNDKLILITNDDGLYAAGLRTLLEVIEEFGKVVLISTMESMSGMSQALTVKTPLRVKLLEENENHRIYACNGTPTDSVKLAVNQLLERKPDWVVSGINHGANASVSVLYSGTMAAAIEGCLYEIPAIGFSLLDFSRNPDFSASIHYVRKIAGNVLENGIKPGTCLNVNIPKLPFEEIAGIRICRQNKGVWREEFDKRVDPANREYYWLTGEFYNLEPHSEDTDEWALHHKYVSIVPVQVDMTAYDSVNQLNSWNWDMNK